MQRGAMLMGRDSGGEFVIRVTGELCGKLTKDLTDQGFPVLKQEVRGVTYDEAVGWIRVAADADELALYGFLGFWNEHHFQEG